MLGIKQTIALALIPSLVIVSAYIIPSIFKSIKSYDEIQKSRKIHILMAWRFCCQIGSYHLGDTSFDTVVDLELTYPHSTLVVDEPVNVSGFAIIKPEYFPTLRTILVSFGSARAYPITLQENGLIESAKLELNKSQNNRLTGSSKMCWPLEGKYKATFIAEFENDPILKNEQITSTNEFDLITVYPKSEIAQITTNKAIIVLTIALYFLGVVGTIKIIIDLLTFP